MLPKVWISRFFCLRSFRNKWARRLENQALFVIGIVWLSEGSSRYAVVRLEWWSRLWWVIGYAMKSWHKVTY